jgi:hypothetical protein
MRYVYRPHQEAIEARKAQTWNVLTAIGLGLSGALFFFFFL